ncbi:MAG: Dabb family protein [Myxococcota bacterium]
MAEPGFRHVVLLQFQEGTDGAAREAIRAGLAALPAQIPELRAYHFGDDLGLVSGNFDFGIVADFDDEAAWRTYVDHPSHQDVIARCIKPVLAQRFAVQFALR